MKVVLNTVSDRHAKIAAETVKHLERLYPDASEATVKSTDKLRLSIDLDRPAGSLHFGGSGGDIEKWNKNLSLSNIQKENLFDYDKQAWIEKVVEGLLVQPNGETERVKIRLESLSDGPQYFKSDWNHIEGILGSYPSFCDVLNEGTAFYSQHRGTGAHDVNPYAYNHLGKIMVSLGFDVAPLVAGNVLLLKMDLRQASYISPSRHCGVFVDFPLLAKKRVIFTFKKTK
ncbi:hypothetical protein [Zavarzinella formosa]|uniref:hypothetical protein n=1 Tax=Zavarzinella formosa TaxID=360055 RepID=UPI000303E091|nr:hypothetical protein [Zavarzinella formosa]